MGLLGKISGNDDKYLNHKHKAEIVLELLREHAKNLNRNFEDIMKKTNTIDKQSLRLTAFIHGVIGGKEYSSLSSKMSLSKLDLMDRAVSDLMFENKYRGFKVLEITKNISEKNQKNPLKTIADMTFMQGGAILSNLSKKGDDINARFNLTIFLDTLESSDGEYIDGKSNKSPIIENIQLTKKINQANLDEQPKFENINDDDDVEFYLTATQEAEGKDRNEALWAKCMAINEGDEKKAKYNYINKRVKTLKKELIDKTRNQAYELKLKEQERLKKTVKEKLPEESKEQKIRREVYLKLLKPFPEDKSSNVDQELAEDNLFPCMMNSSRRLILINTFNEKVNKRLKNL